MFICTQETCWARIAFDATANEVIRQSSIFWCTAWIQRIFDQICYKTLTSRTIESSSQSRRISRQQREWWWKWSCWSSLEWQEHSFSNMQSSRTNLIHSLSFIVSTACNSHIDSERFSTSENFVHSTHIA